MPAVCSYIAKTSMDKLVQFVERSNNESKLKDFIQRLRDMYRECKHQQMLNELGLSSLFNQSNHSRATWLAFYLACAINGLYLGFYNYKGDDDDNSDIDPNVKIAVTVLGVLQIIVAVFGLVLSIVVRSPVVFNKHMEDAEENGTLGDPHTYTYYRSVFRAIRQTACEPMTVYYMGYVAFAVLGTTYNNFFNVLLLLDLVVKNPRAWTCSWPRTCRARLSQWPPYWASLCSTSSHSSRCVLICLGGLGLFCDLSSVFCVVCSSFSRVIR
jgi:hypothetical protein